VATLLLLPIFSGIDAIKGVKHLTTDNSVQGINPAVPVASEYASERPSYRKVAGRDSFSTPSILNALKDEPDNDRSETRIAEAGANKYSKSDRTKPFSQGELLDAWGNFAETIDAPQIKSALIARRPCLTDNWQIEYELDTELQFDRLTLDIKPKLLGYLRRLFENEAVEIQFKISADAGYHQHVPYTDSEKWCLLTDKYPALSMLKSKFGLDFEHF
jgi:hypothetical protein